MPAVSPLLVTADDALAEEIGRLAAVVGCDPHRCADLRPAVEQWRTASLVLLDVAAAGVAASAMPPRRGLCLVSSGDEPGFWRAAFELGADHAMRLPADEARLVQLLAEQQERPVAETGRVLALIGGCGGAGTSVLASATALTAARRGDPCLLVDCDPFGGGLDLAVGTEDIGGLRWSGLTVSGGGLAASALHEALPGRRVGAGSLTVLSCDREASSVGVTAQAVQAVLAAARRAGETVVCDLPRSLSEAAVTALRLADLTVVVVPAEVRASAAAARIVPEIRQQSAGPVRVAVRGPAPGGLTHRDVSAAVGLEIVTVLRSQLTLPAAVDRSGLCSGRSAARGPIARAARDILAALAATDEHTCTAEAG